MELEGASHRRNRAGCLIMHVNKVSLVKTINLVAKDLGEDEDWLVDVVIEMEPEDGAIWVYDEIIRLVSFWTIVASENGGSFAASA
jgi:hypothetical protein